MLLSTDLPLFQDSCKVLPLFSHPGECAITSLIAPRLELSHQIGEDQWRHEIVL